MPRRLGRLLLAVVGIGVGIGVGISEAAAAERLITIGSDVTEIVFALGAGDAVVAVDSTSRYPEAADAMPDLGYLRQLSAEPIIAMAPSLVLISEEAGPPHVLEQLAAAGVPLELVTAEPSPAALDRKISAIGAATGREAEADALRTRVVGELDRLQAWTAGLPERPRTLLLLSIGQGLAEGAALLAAALHGAPAGSSCCRPSCRSASSPLPSVARSSSGFCSPTVAGSRSDAGSSGHLGHARRPADPRWREPRPSPFARASWWH